MIASKVETRATDERRKGGWKQIKKEPCNALYRKQAKKCEIRTLTMEYQSTAYRDRIAKQKHLDPCTQGHKRKKPFVSWFPEKAIQARQKNFCGKIEKAVKAFSIWQAHKRKENKKMWIDINSNEIITAVQLREEFEENKKNQPKEYNYEFEDYIQNCLVENNGSLIPYDLPFC